MVGQAEQVVTGDAVVLDVAIAQLPVRALSALIDIAVIFVGYVAGVLLWASTLGDFDPALSGAVLVIFTVLTIVGYPLIFESATRGRTLGKMALGLRVVSDDGGPERFRQALFRALASVIEIWTFFGGPAVICSLLSSKGKRIGDVFAGTVVISERGPKLPPPPVMPPSLAWWASSLQLSGLGPEQAELARQFLSRASLLRWSRGFPRRRLPACHRSTCSPQCWRSGTGGSWTGCDPHPRRRRHHHRRGVLLRSGHHRHRHGRRCSHRLSQRHPTQAASPRRGERVSDTARRSASARAPRWR
jgi:uncharacterized RDD family membrane protein YckC